MTAPLPTAFIQGQGTVSADNLNTFVQTVTNVVQLRSVIGLPGMQILLEGLVVPGDGGAGPFYWNTTSIGPDNGTNVIVPQPGVAGAWVRLPISQTSIITVANIAALEALDGGSAIPAVYVEGYSTINDGGEGVFVYNPSDSTSANNGGTIIIDAANHRYYRETDGLAYSILWFGGSGNGITDNTSAMNGVLAVSNNIYFPPGKYLFNSTINIILPEPASGSDDTNAIASVTIFGSGADVTILYWPATSGFFVQFSSQQHSLHVSNLSMTTGTDGTYNAVTFNNSYPFFGTFVAQTDFNNVTFRGDNGYANTTAWGIGVSVSNVSDINFQNCNWYGDSSGLIGIGIEFTNPGAGCFAGGSLNTCGTVYGVSNCNFSFVGTGIVYGANTQTLQVINSFFGQCGVGISSPFVSGNTNQGLSVINSTFFVQQECITLLSPATNLFVSNCLMNCSAAHRGIYLASSNDCTIIGNQFIPRTTPNSAVAGIEVVASTSGSVTIINDNTFSSVTIGILLDVGTSGVTVGTGNVFTGNTTNVVNNSSANIGPVSYDPISGIGYGTGAGGTVTQLTSKGTSVTLNNVCGQIITNNSTLNSGATATFNFFCSPIAATDVIIINATNGNYIARVFGNSTGECTIALTNNSGGNLSDAVTLNYAVIKSVS